jgi:hypothetical protein
VPAGAEIHGGCTRNPPDAAPQNKPSFWPAETPHKQLKNKAKKRFFHTVFC